MNVGIYPPSSLKPAGQTVMLVMLAPYTCFDGCTTAAVAFNINNFFFASVLNPNPKPYPNPNPNPNPCICTAGSPNQGNGVFGDRLADTYPIQDRVQDRQNPQKQDRVQDRQTPQK